MSILPIILASAMAASGSPPLADGVRWIPGTFVAGKQPDGNTVLFDAPDGLVVFDTGRHREHAERIIDAAHATGRPIVAIVNSHWHLDHVGGNVIVRAAYPHARVYASAAIDDALHGFLADYRKQLAHAIESDAPDAQANDRAEIALIDAGSMLAPDERIAASAKHAIGERTFDVGFASHAVTAGDVWLFDPRTRTLASGDLVTLPAPLFDTACASGWKRALGDLSRIDFVRLVPGHGAPMDRTGLATYRRAFDRLLECADGDGDAKSCVDGWMRDADSLIAPDDRTLARTLLDYYMARSLRAGADKQKAFCGA
jgi:glyoxylase-like metal-dependent hydrolase (beta-lactamase superfamily II)